MHRLTKKGKPVGWSVAARLAALAERRRKAALHRIQDFAAQPHVRLPGIKRVVPFDGKLINANEIRNQTNVIVRKAIVSEPPITSFLVGLSMKHGGSMAGLKYRLKTPKSITEKIFTRMTMEGYDSSVSAGGSISDSVRYTMTFDEASYTRQTRESITSMIAAGYIPRAKKLKNYWAMGDRPDYNGLNINFESPEGFRFELQFHTPASFRVKNDINHVFYEQYRRTTSVAKKKSLMRSMARSYVTEGVVLPPGAEGIKVTDFGLERGSSG